MKTMNRFFVQDGTLIVNGSSIDLDALHGTVFGPKDAFLVMRRGKVSMVFVGPDAELKAIQVVDVLNANEMMTECPLRVVRASDAAIRSDSSYMLAGDKLR